MLSLLHPVPPTVTAVDSQPIGVETRDGRPSEITVRFTITRDDPEVALDDITWTYTNRSDISVDVAALVMMDSRFQLSADLRSLTISNLSFFDAGSITVNATNEAGTGSGTLQLIIHGMSPPLAPPPSAMNYPLCCSRAYLAECNDPL